MPITTSSKNKKTSSTSANNAADSTSQLSKTQQNQIQKFNSSFCHAGNSSRLALMSKVAREASAEAASARLRNQHCLKMIHSDTQIHTIYGIRKKEASSKATKAEDSASGNENSASPDSLSAFKLFVVINGAQKIAREFKLMTQLVEWTVNHQKLLVLELKEYQKSLLLSILRKLLEQEHTLVALFDVNNSNRSYWNVVRYATPGNLDHFDELISESSGGIEKAHENSTVMALKIQLDKDSKRPFIAFAAANSLERKLYIAEFLDDTQFSMLGDVLIALNVKECLAYQNTYVRTSAAETLKAEFKYANVELTLTKKKQLFEEVDGLSVLDTLIREKNLQDAHLAVRSLPDTMYCIGAISEHLNLIHNEDNHKYFTLQIHKLDAYMSISNTVMRELNIIPPLNSKNELCLYSLLDKCKTRVGSRLLSSWIRQPLVNTEEIKYRQDLVESFLEDSMFMEDVSSQLISIPDLDVLMKKMHQQRLTLQDLFSLYEATGVIPSLIRLLSSRNDPVLQRNLIDSMRTVDDRLKGFRKIIELSMDIKRARDQEFIVNASLSKSLTELMEDWNYLEGCISSTHYKFCEDCGSTEDLVLLKKGKIAGSKPQYYFRVPRKVAFDKESVVILDQKKVYTLVTNEALQNLSSAINELKEEYAQFQTGITKVINQKVASFLPVFAELREDVAGLDVIVSFARVAAEFDYTRPDVHASERHEIRIRNARHPLLELMMEDRGMVIPNDVHMNGHSRRFYLITGMNCGGKSVYLKMIGLLVLMSQIGSFIPCDPGAIVSVRDSIQARIGTSDSLARGISTFMQEMIEAQAIVTKSTESTLVLMDELGSSTSTYDGFGLAWSISEHLINRVQCMTLFATHFHELTALADHHQAVHNLQVCIHRGTELVMEYKLKEGSAGESMGIDVARIAGFPSEVLHCAEDKLQQLKDAQEESSHREEVEQDSSNHRNAPSRKKQRMSEEYLLKEHVSPIARDYLKKVISIQNLGKDPKAREEFSRLKKEMVRKAREDRNVGKYLLHLQKVMREGKK